MSRRRLAFAAVAAVLVLLFGGRWLAVRYTEHLWFADLGQGERHLRLLLRGLVWQAAAFGAAFVWYGANLWAVYRSIGSVHVPHRLGNLVIAEAVPPLVLRGLVFAAAAVLAVGTAYTFGDLDHYIALSRYAAPLGLAEPVLGKDAAFYLARLPLLEVLHLFATLAALFAFALVLSLYAVTGSLTVSGRRLRVTPHARTHVVVLLTALALVISWAFVLDAFQLVGGGGSDGGVLSAVDRGVRLPAANALAVVALLVAVGTGLCVRWSRSAAPVLALWVTLGLATVLGRYLVPVLSEAWGGGDPRLAASLRQYRDGYTRAAFGLLAVADRLLPVAAVMPAESSGSLASAVSGVVPWSGEPALLEAALRRAHGDTAALQHWNTGVIVRGSGEPAATAPVILGIPQADLLAMGRAGVRSGWTETHRGAQAWGGAAVALDGRLHAGPLRFLRTATRGDTVPPATPLEPRVGPVRFLPGPTSVGIVGATEAAPGHPLPGVLLAGPIRRLLLAWALQSPPLLDDRTTPSDRVLFWRDLPGRLSRLYPFAAFDTARPTLHHGRLVWVADGYLASGRFPLAARLGWGGDQINFLAAAYIATVDAASGETRLYVRPPGVAFARAVARAEGVLPLPAESLDAGLAHGTGYPAGLFGAQAAALALLGDGSEAASWRLAAGDTAALHGDASLLRPTLAVLRLPGERDARLWRLAPLTDAGGSRLVAILGAATDGAGDLRLRLLRLSGDPLPTPQAAAARLAASPGLIAATASGSEGGVRRGPLHAVPAAGGVAFVQVLFAGPSGGAFGPFAIALLEGGRFGMGADATAAVRALSRGGTDGPGSTAAARAIAEARSAFQALEAARRSGDWVAFGRAWEALRRALEPGTAPGGVRP